MSLLVARTSIGLITKDLRRIGHGNGRGCRGARLHKGGASLVKLREHAWKMLGKW